MTETVKNLLSSGTQEWETPPDLFAWLHARHDFTLDPCCREETALCDNFYTKETDGMVHSWKGHRVFMNPTYTRKNKKRGFIYGLKDWIKKAYVEAQAANTLVVALIPVRTDTKAWHEYVMKAADVYLIDGRLAFCLDGVPQPNSTFASALAVFEPHALVPHQARFHSLHKDAWKKP